MDRVSLPMNLVAAIQQYFNSKPHGEVRQMFDAIEMEVRGQQQAEQQAAQQPPAPPMAATQDVYIAPEA
jgi:hypothetical protein